MKLRTSQPAATFLVANIHGASNPSQGLNPTKIRTGFRMQQLPEIPRAGILDGACRYSTPGVGTTRGMFDYTAASVPVASTALITVIDSDLQDGVTLQLGSYQARAYEDFTPADTAFAAEDGTVTAPDDAIVLWRTAGAGPGEGAIAVPVNLPITPGTIVVRWISGMAVKAQTDDGVGGFAGGGTAGNSTVDYRTGAMFIDTTGDTPDAGAVSFLYDYSAVTPADVATALQAYLILLPGYQNTTVLGAAITVEGPYGPGGNFTPFRAVYGGTHENYALVPTTGHLENGEPVVGPPTLLP